MIIDLFKKITINVMDYNTGKSFNAINSAINSNTSLVITNDVQNCLKIFNSIIKNNIKNNSIKPHDVYIIPYNNNAMNLIKDIKFDKIILDDYYTLSYSDRMKFFNCYFNTFNNISVDIEIYSSNFDEYIYNQSVLWKMCFDRTFKITDNLLSRFSYEEVVLFSYNSNNKHLNTCLFDTYIYDFSTYDENVKIFKYNIEEI